jgi:hypothetical protein
MRLNRIGRTPHDATDFVERNARTGELYHLLTLVIGHTPYTPPAYA